MIAQAVTFALHDAADRITASWTGAEFVCTGLLTTCFTFRCVNLRFDNRRRTQYDASQDLSTLQRSWL